MINVQYLSIWNELQNSIYQYLPLQFFTENCFINNIIFLYRPPPSSL